MNRAGEMSHKNLCKLVREDYQKENLSAFIELIRKGKYVCGECGRIAIDKKMLCEPKKMKPNRKKEKE